jgi:exopolysaccharide production protein ExoY
VGVQPLPVDTFSFELERIQNQRLLWQGIAAAERAFSGALLLVLLPFLTFITLITVTLSRRSPVIAHQRVGQGGRAIWVFKLRTMWDRRSPSWRSIALVERLSSDCGSGAINVKNRNDPRVSSRFAALCRRYSIDELPQLWHVVRGEMALVGPRPLTAEEIETYYSSAAHQLLSLKPGITGLWQIKGRSRLSYLQRRRLDLFLVRKWSLRLYMKILVATLPTVLAGKHAW